MTFKVFNYSTVCFTYNGIAEMILFSDAPITEMISVL